jgi:hypothetical protein
MDAPCCDVFELTDGKIILTQLGVIDNLGAALTH